MRAWPRPRVAGCADSSLACFKFSARRPGLTTHGRQSPTEPGPAATSAATSHHGLPLRRLFSRFFTLLLPCSAQAQRHRAPGPPSPCDDAHSFRNAAGAHGHCLRPAEQAARDAGLRDLGPGRAHRCGLPRQGQGRRDRGRRLREGACFRQPQRASGHQHGAADRTTQKRDLTPPPGPLTGYSGDTR